MVCGAIPVVLGPGAIFDHMSVGVTVTSAKEMHGKARMLELTIYGLMGLAVMPVIAFYFAYGDEFPPAGEKSSFDLINNAHLNDSQMIETWTGNPQRKQAPAPFNSDNFQSDRGQVEVFHD